MKRFKGVGALILLLSLAAAASIGVVTKADVPFNERDYPPASGPQSVIVILVKFRDLENVKTREEIRNLVFGELNDYFREVSYGRMSLTGDVTPVWYTLKGVKYYGAGREKPETLVLDAVKAADKDVNFLNYEYILIVHAGDDQDRSGNPDDITSFSSISKGYAVLTDEGRLSFGVICVAEMDPIGPYAHLLARTLGLPKLYHAEKFASGKYTEDDYVGEWGLMAHGLWANNGSTPVHPCAWSKIKLGWMPNAKVEELQEGLEGTFNLAPHEELSPDMPHAIKLPLGEKTYYLIEARKKVGYDSYLPGEGVLIFYVDESKESGKGILKLVDAHPETETLNDAPFKPGDFFNDEASKVAVEILGASGSSYLVKVDRTGRPVWVKLTLEAGYPNVQFKLDGKAYPTDQSGGVQALLRVGNHALEAPGEVDLGPGSRAVFKGWGDGVPDNPRALSLSENSSLKAVYEVQHYLKVESAHGGSELSGWYPEGSKVNVSVSPIVDYGNGTRAVFLGWSGSVEDRSPSVEIVADSPKALTASWKLQRKVSFSVEGLPEGARVSLTVNGETRNFTVPFSHAEWVDEGSSIQFDISPKTLANGGNVYALARWRSGSSNVTSPLKVEGSVEVSAVYERGEAPKKLKEPNAPPSALPNLLEEILRFLESLLSSLKGLPAARPVGP